MLAVYKMSVEYSEKSLFHKIVWRSVIFFTLQHIGGAYGFYLMLFKAKFATGFFAYFGFFIIFVLGLAAGAHRLFCHNSYKARWPLRLLIIIVQTMAMEKSMFKWCRDHRTHHKYADTNADPHNINRGFFFCHIGWLMVKRHPEMLAKAHTIDVSDLLADPLVRFQKKYYEVLVLLIGVVIPTYIPTLWGETIWNAFFVCVVFRSVMVYNSTFMANSIGHSWGYKPYDKNMQAVQNRFIHLVTWGDGLHNFHHAFPWDYKSDEFGIFSFVTSFIDVMAKMGLAYDLKTAPAEVIEARKLRTGDGSY